MCEEKSCFFLFFYFFVTLAGFAQQRNTGTIKGLVRDANTRQVIVGAVVYLEGIQPPLASSTGPNGEFMIQGIPQGRYNLIVSLIGYKTTRWESVEVLDGQISKMMLYLEEEPDNELGPVQITVQRATDTDISLIKEIREAQVVASGISAEQISKSLDSDVAQVIRRLPGVSLVENRYAIVRGLGERYNNVLLNDLVAPNTEVDTRSFAFDLIPASAIDRLLIIKTGSAELPGDFAGAIVKVHTKNAPSSGFLNITMQGGYRLGTTGNQLLTYQGSSTDWLGSDNGTRKLPESFPEKKLSEITDIEQRLAPSLQFSNIWLTKAYATPPDFKIGLDGGFSKELNSVRISNLTVITYQRERQFYEVEQNRYQAFNGVKRDRGEFFSYQNQTSDINTRLGIIHNWQIRFNGDHSLELKNLFNQVSKDRVTRRIGFNGQANVEAYQLFYESRSIYSGQLHGSHFFNSQKTSIQWVAGHNFINRLQPDLRRYVAIEEAGTQNLLVQLQRTPSAEQAGRFFSDLNEKAFSGRLDFEHIVHKDTEHPIHLNAGLYYETKKRGFSATTFSLIPSPNLDPQQTPTALPINQIFDPTLIATDKFLYGEATTSRDEYDGSNKQIAGYLSSSFFAGTRTNITLGVRLENNIQKLTTDFEDTKLTIKQLQVLPSLNVSYQFSERSLWRAAYFRSWNRPEFRELAPFVFYDFDNEWLLAGNKDSLKNSTIDNIDIRWEFYPSQEEMIMFGVFYKYFQNPIEIVARDVNNTTPTLSFQNPLSAQSLGIEAEIRKSFLLNVQATQKLSVSANAAYILNKLDLSNLPGQVSSRPMVNQSPYVVNAALFYENTPLRYKVNLSYNVFGTRLFFASVSSGQSGPDNQVLGQPFLPDAYEMPRHEIDLAFTKQLAQRWEFKFGIQNFLNATYRFVQDSNRNGKVDDVDENIIKYRKGQRLTVGSTFKII